MVAFEKQSDLGKRAKQINSCFRFCTCLPPSRFWAHWFLTSHSTRLWLKAFLASAVIFPWNRSQCICMLPHPSLAELEETLGSKRFNCCPKCAAKSWLDWSQWQLHSHRAWISDLGMYLHHAVGCCSYTCSLHQINPASCPEYPCAPISDPCFVMEVLCHLLHHQTVILRQDWLLPGLDFDQADL